MTKERRPARKETSTFDIDAIARALDAPAEQVGDHTYEIVLHNDPLRLTLRLGLIPKDRQASIYLRGASAFLGMVALWNVTKVESSFEEGKVDFISTLGRSTVRLSVLSTGHFLMDNSQPTSAQPRALDRRGHGPPNHEGKTWS